jgi:predicted nucleic acid-binding protein
LRYLLDASALLPLISRSGEDLLSQAKRESLITTDLAVYEACNSLWKMVKLLRNLSLKDATAIAAMIKDLTTRNLIQARSFAEIDLSGTLEIAFSENLTFYDASYIATAENADAILVTEDRRLRETAVKYVETMTYGDLEKRLSQG